MEPTAVHIALVCLAILLGATTQRLTGLGFALVSGTLLLPALVGILPALWVIRALPEAPLLIMVGSMVLVALTALVLDE